LISIYTDEDVDILLKPLLGAKGYYVITVSDEKMLSKSDKEQFEHAIELKCTLTEVKKWRGLHIHNSYHKNWSLTFN